MLIRRTITSFALGLVLLLWVTTVALPLASCIWDASANWNVAAETLARSPVWSWSHVPSVLLTTLIWGVVTGLTGVVLGLPAAFVFGTDQRGRGSALLIALSICVLCQPAYLGYWSWGLLRLPGSILGEWATGSSWRADLVGIGQVWLALSLWCWPISAVVVGWWIRQIPRARVESLRLDQAGPCRRLLMLLSEIRIGVLCAVLLSGLGAMTCYVVFDLASTQSAGVGVYSEVLRRLLAETWNDSVIVVASLPIALVAAVVTIMAAWLLDDQWSHEMPVDTLPAPGLARYLTAAIVAVSIGMPLFLMATQLDGLEPLTVFWKTDRSSLIEGFLLSLCAGVLLAAVAVSISFAWSRLAFRAAGRVALVTMSLTWIWMGLLPGTTIGSALLASYGHAPLDFIYSSPTMNVLAYIARYGFVAVLAGRWAWSTSVRHMDDLATVDGAAGFTGWLRAHRPAMLRLFVAMAGICTFVSMSEITATVIVTPAGFQSPAERLLNRLHYAREEAALAFGIVHWSLVIIVCTACAWLLTSLRDRAQTGRQRSRIARVLPLPILMAIVIFSVPGCSSRSDSEQLPAEDDAQGVHAIESEEKQFTPILTWGGTGREDGQFMYPRAMAVDEILERIYIIDRSGRIQTFSLDGEHLRTVMLPSYDRGFPTGISVHPEDSRIFVADTHQQRILIYSSDFEMLRTFGEYGSAPGQFTYPTDVAFGVDGVIYVSEYGGNDRIQAFTEQGDFLFEFGTFGRDHGQFNRPQSMQFDAGLNELWIADACNHRLVVTDPDGEWLRTIGTYGTTEGTFCYTYAFEFLDGADKVLVCEYGNNRLQLITRAGEFSGYIGQLGNDAGELRTPWSIAAVGDRLYVLDSGNNRVQLFELEP